MLAAPADDLIRERRDGKHQAHLDEHLQEIVAQAAVGQGGNRGKNTGEDQDAHQEHHQNEGGAAPGVSRGVGLGLGHGQFFPGLKGTDGLVFGAVVLENPANIRKNEMPQI